LSWVGATLESKYRIDALVGEGGFGFVYRGTHLRLGKPVAVKFLRPDIAGDGDRRSKLLRRFETEGRLLYDLSRATVGVVQAHDLGIAVSPRGESTPFIVMEWLDGHTLSDELQKRPTWSVDDALDLLAPVLDALVVAHEMGIVHRDLKPSNLMLCRVGARASMKVLDFGIAQVVGSEGDRLVGTGAMNTRFFSMAYGAPEQFDPSLGPTGPWTDVYAFGLLVIEVVDGRRPYLAEDMQARIEALNLESRPMLRTVRSLDDVMRRVLAVDPRNRPCSAGELKRLLAKRHAVARSVDHPTIVGASRSPVASSPHLRWLWLLVALIPIVTLGMVFGPSSHKDVSEPIRTSTRVTDPQYDSDPQTLVSRWNDAQIKHDLDALQPFYAERVCYYQLDLAPVGIISRIHDFYAKPGASQRVNLSTVKVSSRSMERTRIDFQKSFSADGNSGTANGYLVLDRNLRIIAESDDIADRKLALERLAKKAPLDRCATAEAW